MVLRIKLLTINDVTDVTVLKRYIHIGERRGKAPKSKVASTREYSMAKLQKHPMISVARLSSHEFA
jgi:hypothetical protein